MKAILILLTALVLPVFGQTTKLDADFEVLKKQRDAAVERATEPINKTFILNAKKLVGQAIQAGELDLATKMKQEVLKLEKPVGIAQVLQTGKWLWKVDGHPEWSGHILQFKPDGSIVSDKEPTNFKKWEKVNENQIKIILAYNREGFFEYDPFDEAFKSDSKMVKEDVKRTFTRIP